MDRGALKDRTNTKMAIRKAVSMKQRNTKQLMEKRRRARINSCLETLKTIVLKNTNQDVSQYSKLEKADILEMVVQYMEDLQNFKSSTAIATSTKQSNSSEFEGGYHACADKVIHLIETHQSDSQSKGRVRLLQDLQNLKNTAEEKDRSQLSDSIPVTGPAMMNDQENIPQCSSAPRTDNSSHLRHFNRDVLADMDYQRTSNNIWRPW